METQWVMVFNLITRQGKEETKRTYKVNKKRLVIGSALSSDIRIQQNAVSNVHAVVEMDEQGVAHIYDMASETGVFVNDKKTLTAELRDGDEVKIGFGTLTYKRAQVQDGPAKLPDSSARPARALYRDAQEDFRPLILEDERNVIQIFDYPSSGEQALQIVMYWGDVILDVRHIVDHEPVTLGEDKKATFCVPGIHTDLPLVSFDDGVNLQFTSEMKGVVRTGKQVVPLADLGATRFLLKQNDQAKIQYRDITFYLSYAPLPPHLRRQRMMERDPFYTKIWFSSLLLTAAFIVLMASIQPEKKLETEELPPRVAAIIFKPIPPPPLPKPEPVKPKPEPVKAKPVPPPPKPKPVKPKPPKKLPVEVKHAPKPVPVKVKPRAAPVPVHNTRGEAPRPSGGNEGAGAKAKGPQGKKGAANKPKAAVHMTDSRGNPNAKSPAKSDTPRGQGNVEALFDNLNSTISLKMAAAGAGANAASKNLHGDRGAFTTEGNGGLGQMGEGSGGGGTSQNVHGRGTEGLGDGKTGKGIGAIGSGGNLSGTGHGRPAVSVGNAGDTIVMGGLDKSVIDEVVRRHYPQISHCYSREMGSSPNLEGRISTRWSISGSGRVSAAAVESSSMNNPAVEKCLLGVIKNMIFPEPLGGTIVEVTYPFAFRPSVAGK
jgi:outer membrane biosynthesis protein TonB